MGAGATKGPAFGAPINPRVNYAGKLAKKEKQPVVIDAPVLVKLQNGTVRYRYKDDDIHKQFGEGERIELPHEGPERAKKHGYFFHPTLNDFSEEADYNKEDEVNFLYVSQGPKKAQKKKVFYVFGKGLKQPHELMKKDALGDNAHSVGKVGKWPSVYKHHGHVYMDLVFDYQDAEVESDEDDDAKLSGENNGSLPEFLVLSNRDRVLDLCKRLCIRFIIPVGLIHIYYLGRPLKSSELVSDLRSKAQGTWRRFKIKLLPK